MQKGNTDVPSDKRVRLGRQQFSVKLNQSVLHGSIHHSESYLLKLVIIIFLNKHVLLHMFGICYCPISCSRMIHGIAPAPQKLSNHCPASVTGATEQALLMLVNFKTTQKAMEGGVNVSVVER